MSLPASLRLPSRFCSRLFTGCAGRTSGSQMPSTVTESVAQYVCAFSIYYEATATRAVVARRGGKDGFDDEMPDVWVTSMHRQK